MSTPFITRTIAVLTIITGSLYTKAQSNSVPDTIPLPLDRCISIALSDNPTIRVADMEVTRMDYSKKEVIGQLLPSISFDGNYSRTLEKQTMYMDGGFGGKGTEGDENDPSAGQQASSGPIGIKVGRDNSFSLGFNASMPLIAPQLWKTLKLSDSQILESAEKARTSRLETINQVKNAYYTLLLALDSHATIIESYNMARFTADLYARKYELGAATRYDVLRTEVAVKNVEPELTQAQIAVRQARLQLLILMGMDATVVINPDCTLADYEKRMYGDVLAIDRSIEGNPSLRLLDIQTRQLNDALTVQKMAWWPTLAVSANYNWTSMSNGAPLRHFIWSPYSTVGLTLSIPIFQGGQRYSRIKQSRIQLDEMRWQRANLERTVRMQTDLAMENIQLNVKQISSSAESVKQAETAHDIMVKSFGIGSASYLDLRDSELALTQSRLAYYQSIYNWLVACSDLELLQGSADIEKYTANESISLQ